MQQYSGSTTLLLFSLQLAIKTLKKGVYRHKVDYTSRFDTLNRGAVGGPHGVLHGIVRTILNI
jgi:hypothetical protein